MHVTGLPAGFHVTEPLTIEAGQESALGVLWAEPGAPLPTPEQAQQIQVTATAAPSELTASVRSQASVANPQASEQANLVSDKPAEKTDSNEQPADAAAAVSGPAKVVGNFGKIQFAEKPNLLVTIAPESAAGEPAGSGTVTESASGLVELVIAPGQTLAATVRVDRRGFEGRIDLGKADAGRNLPHGVYVDNIGLNGLLIVEGKNERTFYITAAPWVPETSRPFHLVANVAGNPTSLPVLLHIRRPANP